MVKYIDRLLIVAYIKAYVVCLASMLSLYVVVDLFTYLDDFVHHHDSFLSLAYHIADYYGHQLTRIFQQLCEPIALLAGMFTIAWMQRNNELMPLLSAGVCTRRVVMPVIISACCMLGLGVIDQELIIPQIASRLMADRGDPEGEQDIKNLQGAWEANGTHITGGTACRKDMIVKPFYCSIPGQITGNPLHIEAKEACYIPPPEGEYRKGWLLTGAVVTGSGSAKLPATANKVIQFNDDTGKYFLYTTDADFEAVIRPLKWFSYTSTYQLYKELLKPSLVSPAPLAVHFHMRLTQMILGIILVLMGLSVILRDQNRNVFISAGLCLVLCGVFFGVRFASQSLGTSDYIPPALAAWLPVFCFGPLALVMFDAVHT